MSEFQVHFINFSYLYCGLFTNDRGTIRLQVNATFFMHKILVLGNHLEILLCNVADKWKKKTVDDFEPYSLNTIKN